MAYDRAGTGRWVWIKTIGSADDRLKERWLEERGFLLESVWFPKHPRSLRAGDLLVYYAAGMGVFPAVVELTSSDVEEDPPHPRHAKRWPWRMSVRPRLVIPTLSDAPTLADSGINPLRLRRQSHILLSRPEWERFRDVYLPSDDSASSAVAA